MRITLPVGSQSSIKLGAVVDATRLAEVAHVIDVVGVSAESGVPQQPIGYEEIRRGAAQRAHLARETSVSGYGFAVENGIVCSVGANQVRSDVGCGVIVTPDGTCHEAWTRPVTVPQWVVDELRKVGVHDTTVGKIIAAKHPEAVHDDPHTFLTGGELPRRGLLAELTEHLLYASGLVEFALGFAECQKRGRHLIRIGNESRELSIRSPFPGGPGLAIFDLLGDTKMNRDAGMLLADRIRERADRLGSDLNNVVLLMADGKATALMQVVSERLDLPSVVVRKAFRPLYAGDDYVKVHYSSITTPDKVQEFHLTSGQAATLRGAFVVIVDDVISSGGTSEGLRKLCAQVGAEVLTEAYVFAEGKPRYDLVTLGTLPLYPPRTS